MEDSDDLWSEPAASEVQSYMRTMKPLSQTERDLISHQTVRQASNKKWHAARVGWLTASIFERICRCTKPDSLLKAILYPWNRATSEAIVHGRQHEADALEAYVKLLEARDSSVAVLETGLHLHSQYAFLAASPDRIVVVDGKEGLLEVKCPLSKKGIKCEDAYSGRNFCCRLTEEGAWLKRDHAYFYQVQGHNWCDFVIWTERKVPREPPYLHVERIKF